MGFIKKDFYQELKASVNVPEKFAKFLAAIDIYSLQELDDGTTYFISFDKEGLFVLTYKGMVVGGVAIMFDELFIYTIEDCRDRKFMSTFLSENYINKYFPHIQKCTCAHAQGTDEYNKVKHLLLKSNILLRN